MSELAAEVCDRCGHRAYVRTIITTAGLALFWCKHHYEQHELELIAGKYPTLDHRYELTR